MSSSSQTSETPQLEPLTLTVERAHNAVVIDGKLDDPDWLRCAPQAINHDAMLNRKSDIHTQARLLYDHEALYVGYSCVGQPWATLSRRDDPLWTEEVVELFLDPDGAGWRYLELGVNPLNVQYDILLTVQNGERQSDMGWDVAGLRSAVHVEAEGWSVEIQVPFASLTEWSAGRPPQSGDVWRGQLGRAVRPHRGPTTWLCWTPMTRSFHQPRLFGRFIFR